MVESGQVISRIVPPNKLLGIKRKVSAMFRFLIVALFSVLLSGCPGVVPGSRMYTPSDPQEQQLHSDARRDVFPDDVRADHSRYESATLLWTGVITEVGGPGNAVIAFEHHYWDFVEDYSVQKEIAFLSPRGEGKFRTIVEPGGTSVTVGDMAIAYVVPLSVDADGTVVVRLRGLRMLRRELYATDIMDYGRGYLLKHDMSDFKSLRVPGL